MPGNCVKSVAQLTAHGHLSAWLVHDLPTQMVQITQKNYVYCMTILFSVSDDGNIEDRKEARKY